MAVPLPDEVKAALSPISLASGESWRPDTALKLDPADLTAVFSRKYGDPGKMGPNPRLWLRYGYFLPDEYYESIVAKLVGKETMWLDVGCGRDIFPNNRSLAEILARRCARLVGLDPDPNVDENCLVHERVRATLNDYQCTRRFDVVTLRMVAEHLAQPRAAIAALARLTKTGGRVVVYTVHKWSPAAILARVVPFRLHHAIKKVLWQCEEKDTFPVVYQMNTRQTLARLFAEVGFQESYFAYVADCRIFARFPALHRLELFFWRHLRSVGLRYPECCLLGVYERQ